MAIETDERVSDPCRRSTAGLTERLMQLMPPAVLILLLDVLNREPDANRILADLLAEEGYIAVAQFAREMTPGQVLDSLRISGQRSREFPQCRHRFFYFRRPADRRVEPDAVPVVFA